jgi:hypothetical protein
MHELTSLERIKPILPRFVVNGLLILPQQTNTATPSLATPFAKSSPSQQSRPSSSKRSSKTSRVAKPKRHAGACSAVKPNAKPTTISANRKTKPLTKSYDLDVGANKPARAQQASDDDPDGSDGSNNSDVHDADDTETDDERPVPGVPIASEACATSSRAKCIPEDDYTFHFEYPGIVVKPSLQKNGDSGDGVFATRTLELYEAIPIMGAGIGDSECVSLQADGLDTHLLATAAGVIDGHPRRSPFQRIGNRGASVAFKINAPTSTKANIVRLGMWAVVAVKKIAAGEELLMAYPKGANETYKTSRYTKSPQYYPAMSSCADAEEAEE